MKLNIPKLNLNNALLKQVAEALDFEPKGLVRDEVQALVRKRMEPAIPEIARKMQRDGWVVGQGRSEGQVVRDALFRLWRAVFDFDGGGRVADIVRDSHDDTVIDVVAEPITPETPLEDLVRLVMEATLELAF